MPKDIQLERLRYGTDLVKRGFAKMQKGGVVMDVTTAEEAAIAEEAGAVAVMALERVPADIRAEGGVARMSDPARISQIIESVTIPVMAKARIGHIAEARILEHLGVDMIDESEVLTPADPFFHTMKRDFTVPFVCGATSLAEAVRRIMEGAAMIRTKGEAGTGNIVEAVRHRRMMTRGIQRVARVDEDDLDSIAVAFAERYRPLMDAVALEQAGEAGSESLIYDDWTMEQAVGSIVEVLKEIRTLGRLPVVDFTAGGVATPADAALMMQMGSDGVFVGSGIFKSDNPAARARAIVEATTHYEDPAVVAEVSKGIGIPMRGTEISEIPTEMRLAGRGI
jgi:pyridoxal 5'-phosphate synthase pdxS subunit